MISEEQIFLNILTDKVFRIVAASETIEIINNLQDNDSSISLWDKAYQPGKDLQWLSLKDALQVKGKIGDLEGYNKGKWIYICMMDITGPLANKQIIEKRIQAIKSGAYN